MLKPTPLPITPARPPSTTDAEANPGSHPSPGSRGDSKMIAAAASRASLVVVDHDRGLSNSRASEATRIGDLTTAEPAPPGTTSTMPASIPWTPTRHRMLPEYPGDHGHGNVTDESNPTSRSTPDGLRGAARREKLPALPDANAYELVGRRRWYQPYFVIGSEFTGRSARASGPSPSDISVHGVERKRRIVRGHRDRDASYRATLDRFGPRETTCSTESLNCDPGDRSTSSRAVECRSAPGRVQPDGRPVTTRHRTCPASRARFFRGADRGAATARRSFSMGPVPGGRPATPRAEHLGGDWPTRARRRVINVARPPNSSPWSLWRLREGSAESERSPQAPSHRDVRARLTRRPASPNRSSSSARVPAGTSPPSAPPSSASRPPIIEEKYWGGVCLNVGCIPSKALLRNAELAHIFHAPGRSLRHQRRGVTFDFGVAFDRSRDGRRRPRQGRALPDEEEQDHRVRRPRHVPRREHDRRRAGRRRAPRPSPSPTRSSRRARGPAAARRPAVARTSSRTRSRSSPATCRARSSSSAPAPSAWSSRTCCELRRRGHDHRVPRPRAAQRGRRRLQGDRQAVQEARRRPSSPRPRSRRSSTTAHP